MVLHWKYCLFGVAFFILLWLVTYPNSSILNIDVGLVSSSINTLIKNDGKPVVIIGHSIGTSDVLVELPSAEDRRQEALQVTSGESIPELDPDDDVIEPFATRNPGSSSAVVVSGTRITSPRFSYRLDSHVYSIGTGSSDSTTYISASTDVRGSELSNLNDSPLLFLQEKVRRKFDTAQRLGLHPKQMFPEYADYFGPMLLYGTPTGAPHSMDIDGSAHKAIAGFHSQYTPFEDQSLVLTSLQLYHDVMRLPNGMAAHRFLPRPTEEVSPTHINPVHCTSIRNSFSGKSSHFVASRDYEVDENSDGHYKLRRRFGLGGQGEVWHATRFSRKPDGIAEELVSDSGDREEALHARQLPSESTDVPKEDKGESGFVMKRIFVEKGYSHLLSGVREAYFGELLRNVSHIARFVESFNRTTGHQDELWLVFRNEGTSLNNLLYTTSQPSTGFVVVQPSDFWIALRKSELAQLNRRACNTKSCHQLDLLQEQTTKSRASPGDSTFEHTQQTGIEFRRNVLKQLLQAMQHLADNGIAHRDIKPSNILLKRSTKESVLKVRLCDFGSAVDNHSKTKMYDNDGPNQKQETREYQPPEAIFSRDVGGVEFPYFGGDSTSSPQRAKPRGECFEKKGQTECSEEPKKKERQEVEWYAYDMWSVGMVALEMLLGTSQIFTLDNRTRSLMEQKLRRQGKYTKMGLEQALSAAAFASFGITPFQDPHDFDNLFKRSGDPHARLGIEAFNASVTVLDPFKVGFFADYGGELELRFVWRLLQWSPFERLSPADALGHAFFAGKLYRCPKCGLQFELPSELHEHHCSSMVNTKKSTTGGSLVLRSEVVSVVEQNAEPFTIKSDKSTDLTFRCPVCGREFSLFESCHQHIVKRRHNRDLARGTACQYNTSTLPKCNSRTRIFPVVPELPRKHHNKFISRLPQLSKWCGIRGRRTYFEDYYSQLVLRVNNQTCFLANVLDGHSGPKSARYVALHWFNFLHQRFSTSASFPSIIQRAFASTNLRLEESNDDESGTTLTSLLVCAPGEASAPSETVTAIQSGDEGQVHQCGGEDQVDQYGGEGQVHQCGGEDQVDQYGGEGQVHQCGGEQQNKLNGDEEQVVQHQIGEPGTRNTQNNVPYANKKQSNATVYIAHVGDSRAVVCCNESGGILYKTKDHSPEDALERKRIEKMGGFVSAGNEHSRWRVMGKLAVSRSLGDNHLGKYISSTPDVHSILAEDVDFVVVGTDGLWDVVEETEVVSIVKSIRVTWTDRKVPFGWVANATETLMQEAFVRYSLDNIGIAIIPFKH